MRLNKYALKTKKPSWTKIVKTFKKSLYETGKTYILVHFLLLGCNSSKALNSWILTNVCWKLVTLTQTPTINWVRPHYSFQAGHKSFNYMNQHKFSGSLEHLNQYHPKTKNKFGQMLTELSWWLMKTWKCNYTSIKLKWKDWSPQMIYNFFRPRF